MKTGQDRQRPLRERLMWFVALYVAGAITITVVVYLLRAALFL